MLRNITRKGNLKRTGQIKRDAVDQGITLKRVFVQPNKVEVYHLKFGIHIPQGKNLTVKYDTPKTKTYTSLI